MNNPISVKKIIFVIGFFFPFITGCGKLNTTAKATVTAQAIRYQKLATQMSERYTTTQQAVKKQSTATAEAAVATYAYVSSWPVLIDDSFSDNSNSWPLGTDSGELTDLTIELSGGIIRVDALAKEGFAYWFYPSGSEVIDFALTVEGSQTTGDTSGSYGILFHLVDVDNYSVFRIDEDGFYTLETMVGGEWRTPIEWTGTPHIQRGKVNRIDIVQYGSYLSFYINKEWVTGYSDPHTSQGMTGLMVGLYEPGTRASFEFETFILRTP